MHRHEVAECAGLVGQLRLIGEFGLSDEAMKARVVEICDRLDLLLCLPATSKGAKRQAKYRANLKKKQGDASHNVTLREENHNGDSHVVVVEAVAVGAVGVAAVWDHYLEIRPKTRRKTLKSGTKEYKRISARLKSYAVEDLCLCFDGYERTDWSNGNNDRGYEWTVLMALESGTNVDRGIALAEQPENDSPLKRSSQATIARVIEMTERAGI